MLCNCIILYFQKEKHKIFFNCILKLDGSRQILFIKFINGTDETRTRNFRRDRAVL